MIRPPSPYPFIDAVAGRTGRVTLLGAPLDRTGSFRPGCADGPSGVRWASENLETYSPYQDRDLEDLDLGDLGDLPLDGLSQADAVARIEAEVGALLDAGTLPCVLGGEHTIALPIARAVLRRFPDALVLHLDAHADLRAEYLGEPLSHAAWAYHVGTEFGFDRLVQLGIRSGLRDEFTLGRARSRHFAMDLTLPDAVRADLLARPVYLTLDLDVLDSSQAPGTGTPEAGGPTFLEVLRLLLSLRGMSVVAMDLNEVAPPLDPTGATSAVAAKLVREMVLAFGKG